MLHTGLKLTLTCKSVFEPKLSTEETVVILSQPADALSSNISVVSSLELLTFFGVFFHSHGKMVVLHTDHNSGI